MSRYYRHGDEERGYNDRSEAERWASYPHSESHDYRQGWDDRGAEERREREHQEEAAMERQREELEQERRHQQYLQEQREQEEQQIHAQCMEDAFGSHGQG